jgi:hypothetical protein
MSRSLLVLRMLTWSFLAPGEMPSSGKGLAVAKSDHWRSRLLRLRRERPLPRAAASRRPTGSKRFEKGAGVDQVGRVETFRELIINRLQ